MKFEVKKINEVTNFVVNIEGEYPNGRATFVVDTANYGTIEVSFALDHDGMHVPNLPLGTYENNINGVDIFATISNGGIAINFFIDGGDDLLQLVVTY